jgi:group I intron endonuclease
MIIYKITNTINNKIYVGQKKKFSTLNELLDSEYYGSGKLIKRAINKYGKENFKREILSVCRNQPELDELEVYWIKKLESYKRNIGYNIAIAYFGGDTFTNNPNKEEIRKKMSKATSGKNNGMYNHVYTEITLKRMSESAKNKPPMTDETKKKLSESLKNRKFTEEHKSNLSKSLIGHAGAKNEKNVWYGKSILDIWIEKYGVEYATERWEKRREKKREKNSCKILQYDLCMNYIREYNSIEDAKRITGIKTIIHCLRRNKKHNTNKYKAGDFIWLYKEKNTNR